MALTFQDVSVTSGEEMNADFFNTRFQLIVNEINYAESLAGQYTLVSNELLSQGLTAVNATLGPLVAELTAAATTGFLVTTSTTSLTLTEGVQANFTVPTASAGLFQPTPFLSIQDAGNAAHWATGNLASWNPTTGALDIGIVTTYNGSPFTTTNGWVIAAGSAVLPAALAAAASATSSATAAAASAASAATAAATATTDAAALGTLLSTAGVATVAGLSGSVTASALKSALAITHSDITDVTTALVESVAGLHGSVSASALVSAVSSLLLQLSNSTPLMDGTASAGSSTTAARSDHVHPSASALGSPVWFGSGSDGSVTITTGTTTLTRDMYYSSLTLSGTGKINPNGFRIFVSGTLNLAAAAAGAISMPGATGATLNASGYLTGNSPGATYCLGGLGGAAGGGIPAGAGTPIVPEAFLQMVPYSGPYSGVGGSVCGGGAGAVPQGGSVSSSSGGGLVFIAANVINRGTSSAAGAVSADGGAGTNSGSSNGPGGGGGGRIYIIVGSLSGVSASSLISAAGGAGGNGVTAGGQGGNGGNITVINLTTNSTSLVVGATGAVPSGATGGAGGACAASL